mgnify:CR=1 FL=1
MANLLTTQNILFALTVIGVIFIIYDRFSKPQEALDKRQAINEIEVDGKALLLSEQVKWEREANKEKFMELAYT